MTSLIATDLRAQADRRINDAVTEAREQLAKGWQPHQVLAVMEDAADIVADLWEQAEALRHPEGQHYFTRDADTWLCRCGERRDRKGRRHA